MLSPTPGNTTGYVFTVSPIQQAILTAIKKYERERFYDNETRTTSAFSTVKGQEFYTSADWASMGTIATIDKLSVLISGNRYFMMPRTAQYMEDVSINPDVTGQPIDYGYYGEQLRFYPIPDNAYPINVMYTQRFPTLAAPTDSNIWTTDAEALIRCEAKMDLYENVLQQPDLTMAMRKLILGDPSVPGNRGYLYDMRAETMRRSAARAMRPTPF